jgi:hypothetical protein
VQRTCHILFMESLFAIIGRLVVTLVVVVIFAEPSSIPILRAYGRLHRDPLVPQNSPAYDSEEWGREFWAEQSAFWAWALTNHLPFMV